MAYRFNFGSLAKVPSPAARPSRFRIALLGDFSGRANSGKLETGDALARRKPLRVDVDNLDQVVARLGIELALPMGDGGTVKVAISSMDDFHPDQLYDKLEMFSELSGLRRRLKSNSTFAAAAKEVYAWLGDKPALPARAPSRRSRAVSVPHGKLSDFARLVGQPTAVAEETPASELIRSVVAPFVVPSKSPDQSKLVAAVDEALSTTMRSILHHPDFQAAESLWRAVDLLIRQVETGADLHVVLYDVTAEEFAADLSGSDSLEETGLFRLLVEQPAMDAQQGTLSLIVGLFIFEKSPPHAELLGRMARIAAAAKAPFIAGAATDFLKIEKPDEIHPLIQESWSMLRGMSESAYVGLAVPRFMLRWPYGSNTEPIDAFEFEEFTRQYGLRGMLWGNSAILAAILLGQSFSKNGLAKMRLQSQLSVGDMPFYYYEDEHGDQVALPCTERLVNEKIAAHVTSQGLIPVLSIQGRNEVRLGGMRSLFGCDLAGPWPSNVPEPALKPATAAPQAEQLDEVTTPGGEPAAAGAVSEPVADDAGSGAEDADLDALLAQLGTETSAPASNSSAEAEEMDPELAALLADL